MRWCWNSLKGVDKALPKWEINDSVLLRRSTNVLLLLLFIIISWVAVAIAEHVWSQCSSVSAAAAADVTRSDERNVRLDPFRRHVTRTVVGHVTSWVTWPRQDLSETAANASTAAADK